MTLKMKSSLGEFKTQAHFQFSEKIFVFVFIFHVTAYFGNHKLLDFKLCFMLHIYCVL